MLQAPLNPNQPALYSVKAICCWPAQKNDLATNDIRLTKCG